MHSEPVWKGFREDSRRGGFSLHSLPHEVMLFTFGQCRSVFDRFQNIIPFYRAVLTNKSLNGIPACQRIEDRRNENSRPPETGFAMTDSRVGYNMTRCHTLPP